jgi:hypothetical protein
MNYKGLLGGLVGLLIVAVLTFIGFTLYEGAEHRIELAESWSSDDFNFTATGSGSRTLAADPIGYDTVQKPVACSLFIGSIVRDRKLSRELVDAGFNQMECDGQFGDLQQNLR